MGEGGRKARQQSGRRKKNMGCMSELLALTARVPQYECLSSLEGNVECLKA